MGNKFLKLTITCFCFATFISCMKNTANTGGTSKIGVLYDGSKIQMTAANKAIVAAGLSETNLVFSKVTTLSEIPTGIAALLNQGVRIFVGTNSSSEAAQALVNIENQPAILINPSSTTSILSQKDQLFRLAPPDNYQTSVLSRIMQSDGVDCVFSIFRDDTYGVGILSDLKTSLGALEDPKRTQSQAYSTDPSLMSLAIKTAVSETSKTLANSNCKAPAVQIAAFSEIDQILEAASTDPLLSSTDSKIRWYGSDGSVGADTLLNNPAAASFAVKVHYEAPIFTIPATPQALNTYATWYCSMFASEPDRTITIYDANLYDAVYLAAKTLQAVQIQTVTAQQLEAAVLSQAAQITGVTGPLTLDTNGDRQFSSYDFFGVYTPLTTPATYALERASCRTDTTPICLLGPNLNQSFSKDTCGK